MRGCVGVGVYGGERIGVIWGKGGQGLVKIHESLAREFRVIQGNTKTSTRGIATSTAASLLPLSTSLAPKLHESPPQLRVAAGGVILCHNLISGIF